DTLPLTDPFVLLQTLAAGHVAAATAVLGAAIVFVFYAMVGGRTYCSFVCPVNVITDAARWVAKRAGLPQGWRPARQTRLWLLAAVMAAAAVTGVAAWELLNPVTIVHRALVFGTGYAWTVMLAVFLFDLMVSRRGWCGHLCPQGAFYGLVGAYSVLRVAALRRNECNDCMDCFAVCPEPHVIAPALKGAEQGLGPVVLSRDCTNCGRCIDVCAKDVFTFGHRFNNPAMPANGNAGELVSPNRRAA
ncbi:MAG: quinol dehydrogenase ferredoxin subunit NapH, partial [Rhodospirillales bacterium]|nr:quinol dehydrogenase ferredoxin subunit NapH [Rhodospirillales bacterium]